MKMFKAALNLAYRKEIIGTDKAWRNLMAYKNVIVSRSVFLTSEEIQRLLNVTEGNFHYLVKSALYTGARYGEIINTTVSDFNPIEGTLHLGGKTGIRDCYLNDKAIKHFKTLSVNKSPSDKLHIKDDGNDWGQGSQRLPMQKAVLEAKLPKDTVFYTLRHTHISIALLAGVNIQVVAENCGTSIIMIEKHYGKFMKTDRRVMFNRVNLG